MVLEKVVEERIQAIPLEDFTYIVRAVSASRATDLSVTCLADMQRKVLRRADGDSSAADSSSHEQCCLQWWLSHSSTPSHYTLSTPAVRGRRPHSLHRSMFG